MKNLVYPLIALIVLVGCDSEEVTKSETRLDYYVESYEIPDLGFTPELKVSYEYTSDGKLDKYTVSSYNPASAQQEVQRYFRFSYAANKRSVERIQGYLPSSSTPYVEYRYEYLANGSVAKIKETNTSAGINSEATFTYNSDESVTVSYAYSNGGAFQYEFHYSNDNLVSDQTKRGAQLCSSGQYTYDQHKNPFKELGFVDYQLSNLSVNNKLTEQVNYVGCAFPELVPESYSYAYNAEGYPVTATTNYKSGAALKRSKKEFFYKAF